MASRKPQKNFNEPMENEASVLLKVEELIHLAMGPADQNVVNFKILQTVLFLLARNMRMLDQKVEIVDSEDGPETSGLPSRASTPAGRIDGPVSAAGGQGGDKGGKGVGAGGKTLSTGGKETGVGRKSTETGGKGIEMGEKGGKKVKPKGEGVRAEAKGGDMGGKDGAAHKGGDMVGKYIGGEEKNISPGAQDIDMGEVRGKGAGAEGQTVDAQKRGSAGGKIVQPGATGGDMRGPHIGGEGQDIGPVARDINMGEVGEKGAGAEGQTVDAQRRGSAGGTNVQTGATGGGMGGQYVDGEGKDIGPGAHDIDMGEEEGKSAWAERQTADAQRRDSAGGTNVQPGATGGDMGGQYIDGVGKDIGLRAQDIDMEDVGGKGAGAEGQTVDAQRRGSAGGTNVQPGATGGDMRGQYIGEEGKDIGTGARDIDMGEGGGKGVGAEGQTIDAQGRGSVGGRNVQPGTTGGDMGGQYIGEEGKEIGSGARDIEISMGHHDVEAGDEDGKDVKVKGEVVGAKSRGVDTAVKDVGRGAKGDDTGGMGGKHVGTRGKPIDMETVSMGRKDVEAGGKEGKDVKAKSKHVEAQAKGGKGDEAGGKGGKDVRAKGKDVEAQAKGVNMGDKNVIAGPQGIDIKKGKGKGTEPIGKTVDAQRRDIGGGKDVDAGGKSAGKGIEAQRKVSIKDQDVGAMGKGAKLGGKSGAQKMGGKSGRSRSSFIATEKTENGQKILAVSKSTGRFDARAEPARVGSVEVVTRQEFEVLENAILDLLKEQGAEPARAVEPSRDKKLVDRVNAAEKAITEIADLLAQLIASGSLPTDLVAAASAILDAAETMRTEGRGDKKKPKGKSHRDRASGPDDGMSLKDSVWEVGDSKHRPRSKRTYSGSSLDSDVQGFGGYEGFGGAWRPGSPTSVAPPKVAWGGGPRQSLAPEPVDTNCVTHAELDDALARLRNELVENMVLATQKASEAANSANTKIQKISDKIDVAIGLDGRVTSLQELVEEYYKELQNFDTGVYAQMASFKEQNNVLREELNTALEQLKQVNNNTETAVIVDLTERYETLVEELDATLNAHNGLTIFQRQMATELGNLTSAVEQMLDEKADKEEVLDGLRDKADRSHLAGLLTEKEFMRVRRDLDKRLQECFDKFRYQDHVWMDALNELNKLADQKAEQVELMGAREEALRLLRDLARKVRALACVLGDPKAAVLIRKLSKNGICALCGQPALMEALQPLQPTALPPARGATRPPPVGAERDAGGGDGGGYGGDHAGGHEDQEDPCEYGDRLVRKARKEQVGLPHACKRWVGGSHTLIGAGVGRGNVSRVQAHPVYENIPPVRKYDDYGEDGKLYHLEEPLPPCTPCNYAPTQMKPKEPNTEEPRPERVSVAISEAATPVEAASRATTPGEVVSGQPDLPGLTGEFGINLDDALTVQAVNVVVPTSARRVTIVEDHQLQEARVEECLPSSDSDFPHTVPSEVSTSVRATIIFKADECQSRSKMTGTTRSHADTEEVDRQGEDLVQLLKRIISEQAVTAENEARMKALLESFIKN